MFWTDNPAIQTDFQMIVRSAMQLRKSILARVRLEDAIRVIHAGAEITIHLEPKGQRAHGIRVKET